MVKLVSELLLNWGSNEILFNILLPCIWSEYLSTMKNQMHICGDKQLLLTLSYLPTQLIVTLQRRVGYWFINIGQKVTWYQFVIACMLILSGDLWSAIWFCSDLVARRHPWPVFWSSSIVWIWWVAAKCKVSIPWGLCRSWQT